MLCKEIENSKRKYVSINKQHHHVQKILMEC